MDQQQDALDFALALEMFENELYKAVLGTSTSAAQNAVFAPARVQLQAVPGGLATLQQIQKHEAAHVATLLAAGAMDLFGLSDASFDFTGARGAGDGPFAAATTDLSALLELVQGVEDTGVRAYKGQLPSLALDPGLLETALRIHSVEARHASRIRRMRRLAAAPAPVTVRLSGTVRGGGAAAAGGSGSESAAVAAAFEQIYAGESNTTQAGVEVTTLAAAQFGLEAAQEAFDEPLARADVVAIVQPFFVPDIQ